jgi:hypothetical protein
VQSGWARFALVVDELVIAFIALGMHSIEVEIKA